jgi:hypothetical protein
MDHAGMAGVTRRDAGLLQPLRVGLAFVAQWVEFRGVDMRRRQT